MTITDEVAAVLDEAQRRWPDEPRPRLIVRVLLDWQRGGRSPSAQAAARRALVGSQPGLSAEHYATYDKDAEWPR